MCCRALWHWSFWLEPREAMWSVDLDKKDGKTKRKQKEQVRQPGRISHLQRSRYSKGKSSLRTPHVIYFIYIDKKYNIFCKTEKQLHENPCLPLFFGIAKMRAGLQRIIFRGRHKPKNRKEGKWAKNRERKKRKTLFFPWFFMSPKGRGNKRAGGGGAFFWYSSVDRFVFGPSCLGVHCHRSSQRKRYYTTEIVVSALFRVLFKS